MRAPTESLLRIVAPNWVLGILPPPAPLRFDDHGLASWSVRVLLPADENAQVIILVVQGAPQSRQALLTIQEMFQNSAALLRRRSGSVTRKVLRCRR